MGAVSDWLAHPLLLLLAGAFLTSLVVPRLTRHSQNRDKELTIKSELFAEINDAVADFVTAIQFAELGAASQSQETFDAAYRKWIVASAVISSKIRVYFPDTPLARDWDEYGSAVERFYALSGIQDRQRRDDALREIAAALSMPAEHMSSVAARPVALGQRPPLDYQLAWDELKREVPTPEGRTRP